MDALTLNVVLSGKTMNHLQEVCKFLWIGGEDSARRLIENLNTIVSYECNIDFNSQI